MLHLHLSKLDTTMCAVEDLHAVVDELDAGRLLGDVDLVAQRVELGDRMERGRDRPSVHAFSHDLRDGVAVRLSSSTSSRTTGVALAA